MCIRDRSLSEIRRLRVVICHSIRTVANGDARTSRAVQDAIGNYSSAQVPEKAARFARVVVAKVAPKSVSRAKALLWACSRLSLIHI